MSDVRLPQPGGDRGNWGEVLNNYLRTSLNEDGTLKDGIPQSKIQGLQASLSAKVSTTGGVTAIWSGTQAQYDAIGNKVATTLYVITEA
jgi:hypothetical protein